MRHKTYHGVLAGRGATRRGNVLAGPATKNRIEEEDEDDDEDERSPFVGQRKVGGARNGKRICRGAPLKKLSERVTQGSDGPSRTGQ